MDYTQLTKGVTTKTTTPCSKDPKWLRGGNGYIPEHSLFVGTYEKSKKHFIGKNENEGAYGPVVLGEGLYPTSKSAVTIQQYHVLQMDKAKIQWCHTNLSACVKLPIGAIPYIPKYPKVFIGKHDKHGVGVVVKHREWKKLSWKYVSHNGKEDLTNFYILCKK